MAKRTWKLSKRTRRMIIPGAIILIMSVLFFGRAVEILEVVQRPLASAGTSVANWVFWNQSSAEITTEELRTLVEQRNDFAVDASAYQALEDENAELRSFLDFQERRGLNSLTARIVGRSADGSSERFLIDAGSEDGLKEGLAVVVGEGILIGKVHSVTTQTATITALTHSESAVAVSLLNKNRTIGIAEGGSGNLLSMSFIPDDELIEPNNLIVTSGLEELVPSGLVVGVVNAVLADDQTPFQQAIVEPMTDPARHTYVLIIIQDML